MITQEQMLPMLVEFCPTFAEKWQEHKEEYKDEENFFHHLALADFARHLTELEKNNQTGDFEKVFELIERFNFDGDDNVQNAVVVSLLENLKLNHEIDGEIFVKYLHTESLKWWSEIGKFWSGKTQYIGQTYEES
jgi:hypothetical protein